ncbi:MAG: hypothetical protein ISR91_07100 [Candidatus Delongbacteria bacterium]|nr:hypothetical protein [Candidatus Delongbacteria bacterium]
MSIILFRVIPLLLLVTFSGLLALWAVILKTSDRGLEHYSTIGNTLLGWCYLFWIAAIYWYQGETPILNAGQLTVFLGGLVWWGQNISHRRVRQRMLIMLPLGAVILFLLAGLLLGLEAHTYQKALVEGNTALHIVISLAGVAMLLGSGVYGAGQFLLHRQIKKRSFGHWFNLLPSLQDLNRLRRFALVLGWLLVTISLLSAFIGTPSGEGTMGSVVSHLHPVLTLWIIITLLVTADRLPFFASEKLAFVSFVLSLAMLILLLVSVVGIYWGSPA